MSGALQSKANSSNASDRGLCVACVFLVLTVAASTAGHLTRPPVQNPVAWSAAKTATIPHAGRELQRLLDQCSTQPVWPNTIELFESRIAGHSAPYRVRVEPDGRYAFAGTHYVFGYRRPSTAATESPEGVGRMLCLAAVISREDGRVPPDVDLTLSIAQLATSWRVSIFADGEVYCRRQPAVNFDKTMFPRNFAPRP